MLRTMYREVPTIANSFDLLTGSFPPSRMEVIDIKDDKGRRYLVSPEHLLEVGAKSNQLRQIAEVFSLGLDDHRIRQAVDNVLCSLVLEKHHIYPEVLSLLLPYWRPFSDTIQLLARRMIIEGRIRELLCILDDDIDEVLRLVCSLLEPIPLVGQGIKPYVKRFRREARKAVQVLKLLYPELSSQVITLVYRYPKSLQRALALGLEPSREELLKVCDPETVNEILQLIAQAKGVEPPPPVVEPVAAPGEVATTDVVVAGDAPETKPVTVAGDTGPQAVDAGLGSSIIVSTFRVTTDLGIEGGLVLPGTEDEGPAPSEDGSTVLTDASGDTSSVEVVEDQSAPADDGSGGG